METRASIRTRFIGPTNYRPSRVVVSDDGSFGSRPSRLVWAWDPALSGRENHAAAVQEWLDKFNPGTVVKGPGLGFAHEYYWTWEDRK